MFSGIDFIEILKSLPAVFLAMSFHEFAHAFTADRLGDPTPAKQGRLTMDPLVHVDWIGLIMFAVFGFGWAKPVQVNTSNFKNKKWGDVLVALAGPAANMILAIAAAIAYFILSGFIAHRYSIITDIIYYIISLNITFALLNLVPIPPFDGYQILKNLFFRRNARFFWKYEQYSIFILMAFILFRIFDYLVGIPSRFLLTVIFNIGLHIFSLF
jgi:Zn-dependent protease